MMVHDEDFGERLQGQLKPVYPPSSVVRWAGGWTHDVWTKWILDLQPHYAHPQQGAEWECNQGEALLAQFGTVLPG